jgi:UDP-N-acetylglucosamine/UDP-N-acetylgalactosamine diphosphorylase
MDQLKEELIKCQQEHLLVEAEGWSEEQKASLLEDLRNIPWKDLGEVSQDKAPSSVEPSRVISLEEREERLEELMAEGQKAYVEDDVAVLMVAGGQGTRLGFAGPKGCFEIGALSGKSVYQIQSEKVLALSKELGKEVPFLIMTSPATDEPTRDFFNQHNRFGLSENQLRFFSQASVPSLTEHGKLVLSAPGELLKNPDGHGGCFTALCQSGLLEGLRSDGIEHLLYIQVDNILAPVHDPVLLGLARLENADVITKVVEKERAEEKVGLLVKIDGVDGIIEYIAMSDEQINSRDENGKLEFRWGNTAMHYWSVDFLLRNYDSGYQLPLHRSKKPLEIYSQEETKKIEGYKHERFIFDLLPRAKVSLGLAVHRGEEFAPLKNAEGVDSPRTVNELCTEKFTRWLKDAGVEVAKGVTVEISPLFALNGEALGRKLDAREKISQDLHLE